MVIEGMLMSGSGNKMELVSVLVCGFLARQEACHCVLVIRALNLDCVALTTHVTAQKWKTDLFRRVIEFLHRP